MIMDFDLMAIAARNWQLATGNFKNVKITHKGVTIKQYSNFMTEIER